MQTFFCPTASSQNVLLYIPNVFNLVSAILESKLVSCEQAVPVITSSLMALSPFQGTSLRDNSRRPFGLECTV